MRTKITRSVSLITAMFVLIAALCSCDVTNYVITPNGFEYRPASVPNPMKGFVCLYQKINDDTSLEYIGLRFSDIYIMENGEGRLNRDYLDPMLKEVAGRGNNAVIRVYMLYPGYNDDNRNGLFIPDELYDRLSANGDIYSNSYEGHKLDYPDFNSEILIECMLDFIDKFGNEYDGNQVIAAIQIGMYGSWGEWNMSGCSEKKCVMTNENLSRIIEEYTRAFTKTKLMGRNPSLGNAHSFDIGYHDDNFLFNTSDFHTKSEDWKNLMKKIDPSYATLQQFYDFINGQNGSYEPIWDKWQTQMFGGEISGMMNADPFGALWSGTEHEVLDYCIKQFHVSWIMGVGRGGIPEMGTPEYDKYLEVASSFGYEIGIKSVKSKDHTGKITTTFTNYGVAPFYYDWTLQYWLMDEHGELAYTYDDTTFKLSQLLPDTDMESIFFLPDEIDDGEYTLCARFVNPSESISKNVKPLNLANNNLYRSGIYKLASVTAA